MTVKADSKGRLTGAQPETRYSRTDHPDGSITYTPQTAPTKPPQDETYILVSKNPRNGNSQIILESPHVQSIERCVEIVESLERLAEPTQVWVETSGFRVGVFDLLSREETKYTLYGFTPSAKGFEDFR